MHKNNIRTEIRKIPHDVITNINVRVATDSAPRSLDRAHYKLLSCADKLVMHEEKTYTRQNVHVCKSGMDKNCKPPWALSFVHAPTASVHYRLNWSLHWLGFVERHNSLVFLELTFTPAWSYARVTWSRVNWSRVNWSRVNWSRATWSRVNWSRINWSRVNWSRASWRPLFSTHFNAGRISMGLSKFCALRPNELLSLHLCGLVVQPQSSNLI